MTRKKMLKIQNNPTLKPPARAGRPCHDSGSETAYWPAGLPVPSTLSSRSLPKSRNSPPVNLAYSRRNRSACCRIPLYTENPKAKRVEFRCPDSSSNPYLAFSALLMAALDGIQNKTDPGQPLDKDLYDLEPKEMEKVPQTPGSLDGSLAALEKDHEFLTKGGVFTADVIESWIKYKRANEVDAIRLRPHPYEFVLYGDI